MHLRCMAALLFVYADLKSQVGYGGKQSNGDSTGDGADLEDVYATRGKLKAIGAGLYGLCRNELTQNRVDFDCDLVACGDIYISVFDADVDLFRVGAIHALDMLRRLDSLPRRCCSACKERCTECQSK